MSLQHASCILHKKDIIEIDRPNNHKIRLGVVCIFFCLLKITSFRTPHNNFKTLTLPSKVRREK